MATGEDGDNNTNKNNDLEEFSKNLEDSHYQHQNRKHHHHKQKAGDWEF